MKVKLPQNFQVAQNLMQNNGNPETIIQQMFKNSTTEQKQNLLNQCKAYGMPEQLLSKLQNMK